MKLRKILYGLTLMLGCSVLASCINDEEGPCLPDSNGKAQVLFTLVLPNNAQTRAEWGTNTSDDSEGLDNYIDLSTMKVFIFATDNTYKGQVSDVFYSAIDLTSDTYEPTAYQFIGTVPAEVDEPGDYKLVVVANTTDIPSNVTWDGLKNIVFEKSGASVDKIPMWGFLKANLTLEEGKRQTLEEKLPLLRAMAKVTINLADVDANKDFTLKSITLNKYNTKGFVGPTEVLPSNAPDDAELNSTSAIDQEDCIHVYTADGYEPASGLEFTVANNGIKDNTAEFFVPEYDNSSKDAYLTVVVTYTDPETKEETDFTYEKGIEFKNYTEVGVGTDEYYNIVRNHHYQFNIIKVTIDGPLYIIPTVLPWIDGPQIGTEDEPYIISASTNMRLFDSWLYRYDTDKYTPEATEEDQEPAEVPDYRNWNESYMVVSTGHDDPGTTVESDYGRPVRSPMIQLVTTGTGTFDLSIIEESETPNFEIIYVEKDDETGETDGYIAKGKTLTIQPAAADAEKKEVYTYFYIVPTSTASAGSTAKVFLYYNDPVVGTQEMPFNSSALPGYSDDSSEFWVYSVSETQYGNGKIDDNNPFLKMYYQDASNPLVPVN